MSMTLEQYVSFMERKIAEFQINWLENHKDDPEGYPNEFDDVSDWEEQFDMFD